MGSMEKRIIGTLIVAAGLLFVPEASFAGMQTYASPGTFTFAVPASFISLTVEVWGAGGGGGGSVSALGAPGGSGAGGGGYSKKTYTPAQITGSISVKVGAGGDGGYGNNYSAGSGTAGTASQFGTTIIANGGFGAYPSAGPAGAGGTASGGDTNTPGADGVAGGPNGTFGGGGLSPNAPLGVGKGGGGNPGGPGQDGQDGMVRVTWNNAPSAPAVSGPTSGNTGTTYTFTFSGANDPDGDTVRYGIDWDNNGTVDEWAPTSGYIASGASQTATRSWSAPNTYRFKVLAQDSKGANSAWSATHTIVISTPPLDACTVTYTANSATITGAGPCTFDATKASGYDKLTVEIWGAGGGGGASTAGGVGGQSSFKSTLGNVLANGGKGGAKATSLEGGAGGTASGGNTNTTGEAGENGVVGGTGGKGGKSPNGGAGGAGAIWDASHGGDGIVPGGGGGGGHWTFCNPNQIPCRVYMHGLGGGGAGGYAKKEFGPGLPASVPVVIGEGGKGGAFYFEAVTGASKGYYRILEGGDGAVGKAVIVWTFVELNVKPEPPSIDGQSVANAGQSVPFEFSAHDPNDDKVRYGIDCDGNGSIDQWAPSYPKSVASDTVLTRRCKAPESGPWRIRALAEDEHFATSTWTTKTVSIRLVPTAAITARRKVGGEWQDVTVFKEGDAPFQLRWSSSNATSCTGTNFSTGGAKSGSISDQTVSKKTTFTVVCSGAGGDSEPGSVTVDFIANNAPPPPTLTWNGKNDKDVWIGFTASSTDPDGDRVRFYVDWNRTDITGGDGGTSPDPQWVPEAYRPGGIARAFSNKWSTAGKKLFRVRTEDARGALSGWTNYNVTIKACTPNPYCDADGNINDRCGNVTVCTAPSRCDTATLSCKNPSPTIKHLTVTPGLVYRGQKAIAEWEVKDIASCRVKSSIRGGDNWPCTGSSANNWTCKSPAGGQLTNEIKERVTYRLHCEALAPHPDIDEEVTVNIAPGYRER